jgi:hypothetical protein
MDLRGYYKRIQELEQTIDSKDIWVVSVETPDGGKAGVITEVPKRIGCQMVVEGRARLATSEEAQDFLTCQQEQRQSAEQLQASRRLQIGVISDQDLRSIKAALRPSKNQSTEVV